METREEWLNKAAVSLATQVLGERGYDTNQETDLPILEKLRVSVSWPSHGGLSSKSRVLGQCWSSEASMDKTTEIFISPFVDDAIEVLSILTHEMLHAAVGTVNKHGPVFKQAARTVGLVGPATATQPSDALRQTLVELYAGLGTYPHAALDEALIPKQSTRYLKYVCPSVPCHIEQAGVYTIRITAKWAASPPKCGCCDTVLVAESSPDGP